MDSNKSIDGLTVKRAKKAPSSSRTPKNTNAKKSTRPTAKKPVSRKSPAKTTRAAKATRAAKVKTTDGILTAQPTKSAKFQAPITPEPETPTETPISTTEDFLQPTQVFNFDENTGELKASATPEDTLDQLQGQHDDEQDEHDNHKKHKQKKVKKSVSKKRKIITSIILIIVLLLIGGVLWLVIWGNDIIAKITGGQGNIFDLVTFMEPTYERLKTDDNGRTNILAIGTSGYNMEGDEGNGVHDGAQLTDSIMVISANQDTGDIAMLSLPRDLKASPTCTATGKINEVYWCNNMDGNNEQAGAEALMEEVGSILGIDFQYYAHLNWGSLVQIVDTLGGITVTLDEDIND